MKSKLTTCMFTAIVFSNLSFAQPVLQNHPLPLGYSCQGYHSNPVNPGPSGSNKVWDFSSIHGSLIGTISVIDPATAPNFSLYPTANFCIKLEPVGIVPAYDYYILAPDTWHVLAENTGGLGMATDYSPNPALWLKFPFYFNHTVYAPWKTTDPDSGTSLIKYDGYGTLITQFGTYDSVVRIVEIDGTDTGYYWYTTNPVNQIFYTIINDQSVTFNVPPKTPASVSSIGSSAEKILVYPNPGNGKITIDAHGHIGDIVFFDILGKPVIQSTVNGTTEMRLTGLAPGIYYYQFKEAGRFIQTGKLVVTE